MKKTEGPGLEEGVGPAASPVPRARCRVSLWFYTRLRG